MTTAEFMSSINTLLYVAGDRARREGRAMAVEQCRVHGTVRDAEQPPPPGYERLATIQPHEHTEEARMGIAKRIYTAKIQGQAVSPSLLRAFGHGPAERPPRGPRHADDLASSIASHDLMTKLTVDEPPTVEEPVECPDCDGRGGDCLTCAGTGTVSRHLRKLRNEVMLMRSRMPDVSEPSAVTPPWKDESSLPEERKPTRRELALRRTDGQPRTSHAFALAIAAQYQTIPEQIREEVKHAIEELRDYRDEIERGRGLARRFGGGRRYIDDVRRNRRHQLLQRLPTLREFVRFSPHNAVDPYPVLRAFWEGRDADLASSDPKPAGVVQDGVGVDMAEPGADHSVEILVEPAPDPVPTTGPYESAAPPPRRSGRRKAPAAVQINLFD